MAILEAFACGLPVIASRRGAMAEVVEDGRTGLLFAPETRAIWQPPSRGPPRTQPN